MSCIDYHKDDEVELCVVCGKEGEYECRDCENPVCDNCTVPYNQFTQIDYTLCNNCGDNNDRQREQYAKYLDE